jgi:hypothetical protein
MLNKVFLRGNFDGEGTFSVINLPVSRIAMYFGLVSDSRFDPTGRGPQALSERDLPMQQDTDHKLILTTGSISMEVVVAIARALNCRRPMKSTQSGLQNFRLGETIDC